MTWKYPREKFLGFRESRDVLLPLSWWHEKAMRTNGRA